MAEHPRRVDLADDDGERLVIHPLLTAYLDALNAWKRNPSVVTGIAMRAAAAPWHAANRPRLADDSTLLTALRGDDTGGPHISPDAPAEVWGAWRGVMGVRAEIDEEVRGG